MPGARPDPAGSRKVLLGTTCCDEKLEDDRPTATLSEDNNTDGLVRELALDCVGEDDEMLQERAAAAV